MDNEEKKQYLEDEIKFFMDHVGECDDKVNGIYRLVTDDAWNEFSTRFLPFQPEKLYKYRACNDWGFEALENETAYFGSIKEFDDTRDSKLEYDLQQELKRFKNGESSEDKLIRTTLFLLLVSAYPSCDEKAIHSFVCDFTKGDEYKNIKNFWTSLGNDKTLELLSAMWDPNLESDLNSTMEKMVDKLYEFLNNSRDLFKAFCLAESPNVDRMWADYANKETGFCIEYAIPKDNMTELSKGIRLNLSPVYYGKKEALNLIDFYVESLKAKFVDGNDNYVNWDTVLKIAKTLRTKDPEEWSYQNEWRILVDKDMSKNPSPFPFMTSVYLGSKMKPEHKTRIINIAKRNGFSVFERKENLLNSEIQITRII